MCGGFLTRDGFQSTLPVEGATPPDKWQCSADSGFNPRSPCGERPATPRPLQPVESGFNPRSPWGERQHRYCWRRRFQLFQSTLPVGGATALGNPPRRLTTFQSTLPVGGATSLAVKEAHPDAVSIHAPRGGSDPVTRNGKEDQYPVSIHAPRVGSDRRLGC